MSSASAVAERWYEGLGCRKRVWIKRRASVRVLASDHVFSSVGRVDHIVVRRYCC